MAKFSSHFRTSRSNVFTQATAFAQGLFLAGNRNIERICEQVPDAEYHALQHFISHSPWDDQALCNGVARYADKLIGGKQTGLIIDPTGFPKKGEHSGGVGRQWIGRLGKIDNGQVGVVASLVRGRDVCLVDKDLYLPRDWCNDPDRCNKAKIPEDRRVYRSNPQIALDLVKRADENGLQYGWIGVDCEFGKATWFLDTLDDMKKEFIADVPKHTQVLTSNPILSFKRRSKANKNKFRRFREKPKPKRVDEIARLADVGQWKRMVVRSTTRGPLMIDVLHLPVWVTRKKGETRRMHLIVRRDRTKNGVRHKYSLSNARSDEQTIRLAQKQAQRFWVEQSIKEHKSQLGLGDYQVRLWRGWHHHVAMTILLGLFLLETRLGNSENIPLLTAEDIRYLLKIMLTRMTVGKAIKIITTRHRQRIAGIVRYYRRE